MDSRKVIYVEHSPRAASRPTSPESHHPHSNCVMSVLLSTMFYFVDEETKLQTGGETCPLIRGRGWDLTLNFLT